MPANIGAIYRTTVKYMPRIIHKLNRSRAVHRVVVVAAAERDRP
jgi:hypothetical protein